MDTPFYLSKTPVALDPIMLPLVICPPSLHVLGALWVDLPLERPDGRPRHYVRMHIEKARADEAKYTVRITTMAARSPTEGSFERTQESLGISYYLTAEGLMALRTDTEYRLNAGWLLTAAAAEAEAGRSQGSLTSGIVSARMCA